MRVVVVQPQRGKRRTWVFFFFFLLFLCETAMALRSLLLLFVSLVLLSVACGQLTIVQFGKEIPSMVQQRTISYLEAVSQYPVKVTTWNDTVQWAPSNSFIIACGNTTVVDEFISAEEVR
jgi:hypothetical protein